jgi:hypothetical protein
VTDLFDRYRRHGIGVVLNGDGQRYTAIVYWGARQPVIAMGSTASEALHSAAEAAGVPV